MAVGRLLRRWAEMTNFIQFALLGLATGSLYGLTALGVVLVYRASGILNFASGATGAVGAFIYYRLISSGWSAVEALPVGLVAGALVGLLTYYLIMRVLSEVSRLAKLVATLGILASLESILVLTLGSTGFQLVNGFFPVNPIHIYGSITIGENRLILIVVVAVLASALAIFYRKTKFGLATSAVAENRRAAAALGTSPAVIEAVNFMVAGLLSALGAILLAPIVGLSVATLSLMIVPAFAAAAVGRFSSFVFTMFGAAMIGIIEAEMVLYVHTSGWADAVPFFVIVVVITAGGTARQSRGDLTSRLPLPGSGRVSPSILLVASLIAGTTVFFVSTSWLAAIVATTTIGILGLSIIVVTGYTGQLSLAQFALAGFGAWVAGRLVAGEGLPFWLAALLGIALTIPAGLFVALPALRTRGVNLAVVTLGLSIAVESLIFNNPQMTGGFSGTIVPSPSLFGINLDPVLHPSRYALLTIICFVLAGVVVTNVRRGRSGRRMLAVRSNERAAASLGVGVYGVKMYSFGLAAGIAALAGILIAFTNSNIVYTTFNSGNSIGAIQTSTIGGIGWGTGSIVAGVMGADGLLSQILASTFGSLHGWFSWFPEISPGTIGQYLPLIAGLGVVQVLKAAPDGLAPLFSADLRKRFPGRRPRKGVIASGVDDRKRRLLTKLEVKDLSVHFGGVKALSHVSLTVEPGEILGVIGPNGAGKTTLLDAITGFVKPANGSIKIYDRSIIGYTPEKRSRLGLVRSFQAVELFAELTIHDNLLIASDSQSPTRFFTDLVKPGVQADGDVMNEVVRKFRLTEVMGSRPSELSHGTARLAGIARAMATQPSVLLLDEPASGLDTRERGELKALISAVSHEQGVAVVLIEHDVGLVLETCDRVMVLNFGEVIALGTPEEIRTNPAVISAYLGVADDETTQHADEIVMEKFAAEARE